MEIINYEEKEMIPLADKQNKSSEKQKVCHICRKEVCINENDKVRDHCHYTGKFRGAAHSICNLSQKVPREIPIIAHNLSIYDVHFIMKQFVKEFDGEFESLGEKSEKYITFSAPIKKELDNGKPSICKLKFIDSFRFMSTSLSDLVDNLSEINKKE